MHRPHKFTLIVSLGPTRIRKLRTKEAIEKKVVDLAKALRPLEGVRQIECFLFRYWKSDPKGKAPWKPYGVVIFLEAPDDTILMERVENIWKVASEFDQEAMGGEGVDNW